MFKAALGKPVGGMVEVAGPERFCLAELVQRYLDARKDGRKVIGDVHARYFGAELGEDMPLPGISAHLASTTFEQWMSRQ